MSNDVETTSTALDLPELKKLFGSSPVLSSENSKAYDDIMDRFMKCIKPRDFIEQMFVKDLTDTTWDIMRYSRHKTLVIEREFCRHQEMEAKRLQKAKKLKDDIAGAAAERAKKAEQTQEAQAEQANQQPEHAEAPEKTCVPTTQFERMLELEQVVDTSISDVDEILDAPAEELDHAKALESGINYFERLDRLMSVSIARRDDALKQVDFYRQGLGHHLRRISDEIIDAEFSETQHEVPSVAGPGDTVQ